MYAYGIRGNASKLLKSYLTGRTQYKIHNVITVCNFTPKRSEVIHSAWYYNYETGYF